MIEFSNEEKIVIFDKIAQHYFEQNFGEMSKSDFELLLFSEYIEHLMKNKDNFTDYALSKQLGITQSRIRSLKERYGLKYRVNKDFAWKDEIVESLKNAKYDEYTHNVKLLIQDVNVQLELRNYIEENGWYDEYSLNRKMSVIPLSGFIDIFVEDKDFNDEAREKIIEISKSENPNIGDSIKSFAKDFSKDGLKSFVMSASKIGLTCALNALPFGGLAKTAIDILVNIISD